MSIVSISNFAPGAVKAAVASAIETFGQLGSSAISGSLAWDDKANSPRFEFRVFPAISVTLELIRAPLKAIEIRN
jgi:hypothetical protein